MADKVKKGGLEAMFLFLLTSPVGLFDDVYDGPILGYSTIHQSEDRAPRLTSHEPTSRRRSLVMPLHLVDKTEKVPCPLDQNARETIWSEQKQDPNSSCIRHHYLFNVETSLGLNVSHVAERPSISNRLH